MEEFLNSYNLSAYKEVFLSNWYDDLQQLMEMADEELPEMAEDVVWRTIKGHIRRLISGVATSKNARNNPPTTENAGDEKGDLDNPQEAILNKNVSIYLIARDTCFVLQVMWYCVCKELKGICLLFVRHKGHVMHV